MTEAGDNAAPISAPGDLSAGAMLRAAREGRGMHIAALAAAIKVAPRKLESLEADRYDELPNLTFTRALAQTVCRALKIAAEPVLDRLPPVGDMPKLSQVGAGLNAPFRDAPGSRDPGEFTLLRKPMFWATLVVLAGALALALLPERWIPWRGAAMLHLPSLAAPSTAPAAASVAPAAARSVPNPVGKNAVAVVALPSSAAIETTRATPLASVAVAAPAPAPAPADTPAQMLALRTSAESWVEVQDSRGQTLLSRIVLPGESVGLEGALPLRLTIGNAAATWLHFRGRPVDLAANTRDNVAHLQLP